MKTKSKYQPKYKEGRFELKLKRSQTGFGLFALEDIPKNASIIEYKGRTLSKKEKYSLNNKYLFEINRHKTIDGSARSNTARYINHSCRPNAIIEIWKQRIWIVSKRKIKTGEEINYDYDKEYFDEYIKPLGCKCEKCLEK